MAKATIPRIGDVGGRLDLDIRQGATFGPYTVEETGELPDGTIDVIDLTGCTLVGQIRKNPNSVTVVATFTCTIIDALNGWWTFELSDEVTAGIIAGTSPNMPDSRYTYDIELHDAMGNVYPRLFGGVFVTAENTKI